MKILLVEDDVNFGAILRDYLELNDYEVAHAKDGEEGLELFKKDTYDLCIFDVMMPKKDGFTLAQDVRKINVEVPIVFLTAKKMKEDILRGYEVGADDFLNKPFDSEVLLLKIQAILNRKQNKDLKEDKQHYEIGGYAFDSKLRLLKFKDEPEVKLSPKENMLLKLLATYKNELMPREMALVNIWGEDNYFTSRSMDVYIAKLRKYLKQDTTVEIVNLHGEGFRLVD